jgi:Tropinone reductase 1
MMHVIITAAAMNQLARDLAFEWAADNIRVNIVAPGFTDMPAVESIPVDMKRLIEDRIPLRRFADAAEIARVFAFLCMPAASYITGAVITADGGMTIHASPFPCASVKPSPPTSSSLTTTQTDTDNSHQAES